MRNLIRLFTLAMIAVSAAAQTRAVVRFSDGSSLAGTVSVIGSRPLTLVPLGERRQRFFELNDLLAIDQEIEQAELAKPWTFKESGRPEKVYFEGEYPLLNFKTRLTLVTGQVVTGHLISAALQLKGEEGKRKLFLKRQIKGEKSEKVADIVYPEHLRFPDAKAEQGGTIAGRVSGWGRVQEVTALDLAREQVLFAQVTPDGAFDFGTVLPGAYDLCVLTDTHVLCGLSDASVKPTGEPLTPEDLPAINTLFPLADDFFNDRWILRLAGTRAYAKALVYKRRSDYYEADRWTPGGFLWHLEVWSWHRADTDWKLDKRFILIRRKQKGGEANRKLIVVPALNAVSAGTELPPITPAAAGENRETWRPLRDLD